MKTISYLLGIVFLVSACTNSVTSEVKDWTYIAVDSAKQKWGDWQEPEWLRYFGIDFGDVNRDGNIDIISGRYIYKNPGGDMESTWKRISLDENVDAIFHIDADGDQYADIIAQALPGIYWFEAIDPEGEKYSMKQISTIPATGHVNSQGFEKAQIIAGGKTELLIASNGSIYCIQIPEDPETVDQWPTMLIADNTSDEGIGYGDIDQDGDIDIACGRRPEGEGEPLILVWYENPGSVDIEWKGYEIGRSEHPIDRVELGDLDGDGQLEIVASEERYPGEEPDGFLLWFSVQDDLKGEWERHKIVQQYSMNNLDLADFDQDGDLDIVTNEHKGQKLETQLWVNDGNAEFTKSIIDTLKENHLGTQVIDIDGDGDLDIAGCAWDNYRWMHLWRNNRVKAMKPGSTFRIYSWTTEGIGNEPFLRVGGRMGYGTDTTQFPPSAHVDGQIRMAENIDLEKALYAELIIERLQSHEGTNNLEVSVNGNDWMPVHEPHTMADSAIYYMFHFYPRVKVPLEMISDGIMNIRLRVGDFQEWGWPQNLFYGVNLCVYYDASKSNFETSIDGLSSGDKLGKDVVLKLDGKKSSSISKVDYIGFYEDVNWPGDGKYLQWQLHPHMGEIRNHIGSSVEAPFEVTWDTEWLPDQEADIKVMARIETTDGLVHLSEATDKLELERDYSVQLLKPTSQPLRWSTRSGQFNQQLYLDNEVTEIEEAKLYWKSWSPCYNVGMEINGNPVLGEIEEWPCYAYYEHELDVEDVTVFLKGANTVTTLKTPLHDGHMVHGMEVQWPGIQAKIKVKKKESPVQISECRYEDRAHFLVHTENLTYYFDQQGGGFSRIIDQDGNDWISFKMEPWGIYPDGAASAFRGIPNLVFQQVDDGAGHPGHNKCVSEAKGNTITSGSLSGLWEWTWTFSDAHATLDITKTDPDRAYWFLYEGTPGGSYKPGQSYFGSDLGGPESTEYDFYKGNILWGNFQWMYAGTSMAKGALYMVQTEADQHSDMISFLGNTSEGIASPDGMTVFGFGRGKETNPLMTGNQQFVIGLYPEQIDTEEKHAELANHIKTNFLK